MERRWFGRPAKVRRGGRANSDTDREGSKVWAERAESAAGRKVFFHLAMNDGSSGVTGSLHHELNAAALWQVQTRLDFLPAFLTNKRSCFITRQ